ncbi:MAG: hypothetical protein ACRD1T_28140, partial [Acidimicrobiia bacterium]
CDAILSLFDGARICRRALHLTGYDTDVGHTRPPNRLRTGLCPPSGRSFLHHGRGSITPILAYPLGEPTKAPHIAPAARGPPWDEEFDTREGDTFALSEPEASESQGQGVALFGAPRTQQQGRCRPIQGWMFHTPIRV